MILSVLKCSGYIVETYDRQLEEWSLIMEMLSSLEDVSEKKDWDKAQSISVRLDRELRSFFSQNTPMPEELGRRLARDSDRIIAALRYALAEAERQKKVTAAEELDLSKGLKVVQAYKKV